jgi:hypothetical protein
MVLVFGVSVPAWRNHISGRVGAGVDEIRRNDLKWPPGSALQRCNPSLRVIAIDDALRRITHYAGTSLIESNRELYHWIRNGVPVDVDCDEHTRRQLIQVIKPTDSQKR